MATFDSFAAAPIGNNPLVIEEADRPQKTAIVKSQRKEQEKKEENILVTSPL